MNFVRQTFRTKKFFIYSSNEEKYKEPIDNLKSISEKEKNHNSSETFISDNLISFNSNNNNNNLKIINRNDDNAPIEQENEDDLLEYKKLRASKKLATSRKFTVNIEENLLLSNKRSISKIPNLTYKHNKTVKLLKFQNLEYEIDSIKNFKIYFPKNNIENIIKEYSQKNEFLVEEEKLKTINLYCLNIQKRLKSLLYSKLKNQRILELLSFKSQKYNLKVKSPNTPRQSNIPKNFFIRESTKKMNKKKKKKKWNFISWIKSIYSNN